MRLHDPDFREQMRQDAEHENMPLRRPNWPPIVCRQPEAEAARAKAEAEFFGDSAGNKR